MEKINYQLILDRTIAKYRAEGRRDSLLLHVCCAPCASYVLEYLTQYFDITVFFSNSNITDKNEYEKRLTQLYKFCADAPFCKNVNIIEDAYAPEEFYKAANGFEKEPEGGLRCNKCFELRLSKTADFAEKNGFGLFATTLTVSPHKNAALINGIGEKEAEKRNIGYLVSDFKKRGGYQRSIVLSREYDIYRQKYCGCIFSNYTLNDADAK